jgi:membrane protein required for colicin V production
MEPAVNSFDAVIAALALIAAVMGFMTGAMRSVATVIAYLAAAPLALAATPYASVLLSTQAETPPVNRWIVLAALFVVGGMLLGVLLRGVVTVLTGPTASLSDRFVGALFGAARIGFAAILMVLVFDRVIPAHLEPDFLAQSRLRPILSAAGAKGLRTLPPEAVDLIDRLKREHGII